MSDKLSVGIMGAGRMAQGFDAPDSEPARTLANAIRRTDALELGGFFDSDPDTATAAEAKWRCPATPRNRTAWLAQDWDLIAIATPDTAHAADLRDALTRRPRAIVVEKPIALDHNAAQTLLAQAQHLMVPVLVDFPRRYHSATIELTKDIAAGTLGRPLAATFVFSGSAAHSAIHMLDLLYTWWGAWTVTVAAEKHTHTVLELRRGDEHFFTTFISLPPTPYVWEMRVYCQNGRVELAESPEFFQLSAPAPHPHYPLFDVLQPRRRAAMEAEPLLERLFAEVVETSRDTAIAARCLEREIASHKFVSDILRHLDDRIPA